MHETLLLLFPYAFFGVVLRRRGNFTFCIVAW